MHDPFLFKWTRRESNPRPKINSLSFYYHSSPLFIPFNRPEVNALSAKVASCYALILKALYKSFPARMMPGSLSAGAKGRTAAITQRLLI